MPTGHCLLCPCDVPEAELVDHLRRIHPDRCEGIDTWPVTLDAPPQPNHFGNAVVRT